MTSERHCLEQIAVSLVEIQQTLVEIHKLLERLNNPPIAVMSIETEPLVDHDHRWVREGSFVCSHPGCDARKKRG